MIDYKNELNQEQLKVVEEGNGPCLVLAGAGSGKTRAITYRVAYLLENGIDPKKILLVTFTNKAAKEMINRVRSLTSGEMKLPWSGTFHHIGYRVLRQYASLLNYKNNFGILDSQDSRDVLKLCLKQEGIDRQEKRFPSVKIIQSIISYARNAEESVKDVLELKYPNWLDLADVISRIAQDYNKRKREANVMDFDDLLVNTYLLLLKSETVRKKFSEQFEYVLVDEYQDTNKIQASIIKLLSSYHKNILVVGDDAQSIYSFRAADIQNILDFEKDYPNARIFKLETNYRSTPDILDVANDVIDNNINQHKKELKSLLDNFTKPELHAFANNQEEADFVADRILELCDEGISLNKIAVLFRAAFHSQALEVELTKRGIEYEYRGGVRFFERAHIKDVLGFLRIFSNIDDAVAWNRVLSMQIGIGQVSANNIIAQVRAGNNFESIGDGLSARAKTGWNDFLQIWYVMEKAVEPAGKDTLIPILHWDEIPTKVEEKTPSALIQAVVNSKYKDYLENEYPDYRERLQDLGQLAVFAERQKDLDKFLAEATLQEGYSSNQAQGDSNNDNKLILSTIHQAKGLEWEAVFIINLSAGQFPSDRSLKERSGLEEERRLFYVAITRAQKYLYFSYPLAGGFGSYMKGNAFSDFTSGQGPSMFLDEINHILLDKHNLQGGTIFDGSNDEITYISEDDSSGPIMSFLSDIDDL